MGFEWWHLLVIVPTVLMYVFWLTITWIYVRDFRRGYQEAEKLYAKGKEIADRPTTTVEDEHDNVTPLFPS